MNREEIICLLETLRDLQRLDSSRNLLTTILNTIEKHSDVDDIDMSDYGKVSVPGVIVEESTSQFLNKTNGGENNGDEV